LTAAPGCYRVSAERQSVKVQGNDDPVRRPRCFRQRQAKPDLVNMAAYGHVTTVLTRDGRRLARIVPEEDAWVYSPAWQEKLQQAEADLAAGRVRRFDSDDEFLGHLEAIDDEADG
jgi:hypothetical protein